MKKHSFAILENFDKTKEYSLADLDNLSHIKVDDTLVAPLNTYIKNMKTYHISFDNPSKNLNYKGITIIPPSSLMFFYDIVTTLNQFKKSKELTALQGIIIDSKRYEKPLIHFGI